MSRNKHHCFKTLTGRILDQPTFVEIAMCIQPYGRKLLQKQGATMDPFTPVVAGLLWRSLPRALRSRR
jgi:hypothetical protein